MSRSITSPIHNALVEFLILKRKEAKLTQAVVAGKLGRHQSFVATVESGQRRIDIVDLFEFAKAIGFDPNEAIAHLKSKNISKKR